jgi:lipopolysaccharide assembly outer membrane protein LptD (OstA)
MNKLFVAPEVKLVTSNNDLKQQCAQVEVVWNITLQWNVAIIVQFYNYYYKLEQPYWDF